MYMCILPKQKKSYNSIRAAFWSFFKEPTARTKSFVLKASSYAQTAQVSWLDSPSHMELEASPKLPMLS